MKRLDTESGGYTARIFQEMLGVRPAGAALLVCPAGRDAHQDAAPGIAP